QSKEYLTTLQAAAAKRLEERTPDYLRHLQQLTEDTAPVVSDAFSNQFQKDLPLFIQGLEKESEAYRNNVQQAMLTRLDEHSNKSLEKHRQQIEAEIAAIDNKLNMKRVEDNLFKAVHKLVDQYEVAELHRQLEALADNWEKMPAAEQVKGEIPP